MSADKIWEDYDDGTGLTFHRILEFMYPMESVSFPYDGWLLKQNGYIGDLAKYFSNTCGYVFRSYRSMYKTVLVCLSGLFLISPLISDLFVFYVLPFLLIGFTLSPIAVFYGVFTSFVGSIIDNINESPFLFVPPIGAFIYAVSQLLSISDAMNPSKYIVGFGIFLLSFPLMYTQWFWYLCIGIALWLYGMMFLVFSPLAQKNGRKRIVESITHHWKGLSTIFLICVFFAGTSKLSSTLSSGVIVGIIISLFMIYKT